MTGDGKGEPEANDPLPGEAGGPGGSGRQEPRVGPTRARRSLGGQRGGQSAELAQRLRDLEDENERLRLAQAALEESRADLADRYAALERSREDLADRYDFAPAAFFTLDDQCR